LADATVNSFVTKMIQAKLGNYIAKFAMVGMNKHGWNGVDVEVFIENVASEAHEIFEGVETYDASITAKQREILNGIRYKGLKTERTKG
jgi:hypothetical protein